MSSQCLLLLSFQCSFFCHPSSPYNVIPVSATRMTPYLTVIPPRYLKA
ncbi:hypothetical protein [Wolbachia endosymbiont (group A) of Agelastica alni]